MDENQYVIGLDFGSLSLRGVLADTQNGRVIAEKTLNYPHGVLTAPPGTEYPGRDWELQCPRDYLDVLYGVVSALMEESKAEADRIVGIGVDFTASTVIPLRNFRPLSEDKAFAARPHAWTKMWKYHGAMDCAARLTEICRRWKLPYPERYGGSISSECLTAKVLQVFEEDREVFDAADCFIEAGDYVTSLLTGKPVFGASLAAAKALWSREDGYPANTLFTAFHPELKNLPDKLIGHFPGSVCGRPGERVGGLCPEMAEKLGLRPGTAVSAPQMDAYSALPGLGITEPGTLLLVIGTSAAALLLGREGRYVEGVTASLPDTCYPGIYTYAAGQAGVGDCFQWCADTCAPESYCRAAKERGMDLHGYLSALASGYRPGQTGLLALDWFNGSKARPARDLSGMILGLTLRTRPEHIYRALMEATAFGIRMMMENFEKRGIPAERVAVSGGIPRKNPFLMQLYADVLGRPLEVSACTQASAMGAAVSAFSASAGGDLAKAARQMGAAEFLLYKPDPAAVREYDALYEEYKALSEYFGNGQNPVMERLGRRRGRQESGG